MIFLICYLVSKYALNEERLKEKYKQIIGFYYVSNNSMAGVETLFNDLLDTTAKQKYIGEEIPEVWLKFEKNIKSNSSTTSLLNYEEVAETAANCGITDQKEIEQCIQFLNDLGIIV